MGMREIHNIIEFEVPSEDVSAALEVIGVPDHVVRCVATLHALGSREATLRLTYPDGAVFGTAPAGIGVAVSLLAHGGASLKVTWDSLELKSADDATQLISLAFPSTLVRMTKVSYEDALATITGVRDDQVKCFIWHELDAAPEAEPGPQPSSTADASASRTENQQA